MERSVTTTGFLLPEVGWDGSYTNWVSRKPVKTCLHNRIGYLQELALQHVAYNHADSEIPVGQSDGGYACEASFRT